MRDWEVKYDNWKEKLNSFQRAADLLKEMEDDEALKEDAFYKELRFGTSGLRGVMGMGTNRINGFVVAKATKGLAHYIFDLKEAELKKMAVKSGKDISQREDESPRVVISYDNRNNSLKYAMITALILAQNNIKAYIFKEMTPVSVLSYGIPRLKCDFGIMITASHNNKKYNGYKVYNRYGYQILDKESEEILSCIDKVDILGEDILKINEEILSYEALSLALLEGKNFIEILDNQTENDFVEELYEEFSWLRGDLSTVSLVYSPLNGTGRRPVENALRKMGLESLTHVESQWKEDGNFPTCPDPNPEYHKTYEEGLVILDEINGDGLIVTDPDCDRFGLATPEGILSGNQVAILLSWYMKDQYKLLKGEEGLKDFNILRSIVSSPIGDELILREGGSVQTTLIGFKYMGERLENLVSKGEKLFLAFEEGNGFLLSDRLRDKDGVSTSMVAAKMIAYYKEKGKTLQEVLEDIYSSLGYYQEKTINYIFEGRSGARQMEQLMRSLRNLSGKLLESFEGNQVIDYYNKEIFDLCKGYESIETGLPASDILEYKGKGWKMIVRRSGTEPKLKGYIIAWHKEDALAVEKSKFLNKKLDEIVEEYRKDEK